MRYIVALLILLMMFVNIASSNQGTITLYGTNASNAQSNLTRVGTNATVNVSTWAIGDAIKTFTINVSDLSDTNNITLGNFTAGRIIEVKVNGTSYNAYLASAQGEIKFNRTQNKGNQTYTATPALQANYNHSWIAVDGVVNPYLPLAGGTMTGNILHTGSSFVIRTTDAQQIALGDNGGTTVRIGVTGQTDAVAIDSNAVFYPLFASTTRPSYRQGGLIFNTTTNSPEYSGDNNAWSSLNHFRNISHAGNTSGKAVNTVYQNANSTPLMFSVSFDTAAASSNWIYVGLSNPPTQLQSVFSTTTNTANAMLVVVPAMHYYNVIQTAGTPGLVSWLEIQ